MHADDSITLSTSLDTLRPLGEKSRKRLLKKSSPAHSLVSTGTGFLDIFVSPQSFDKAILLFDTLIRTCEKRGFIVSLVESGHRTDTVVCVLGERIRIALVEKTTRVNPEPLESQANRKSSELWSAQPKWHYQPSGCLVLRIKERYGSLIRHSLSDTKKNRLESRLEEFLQLLVQTAAYWIAERKELERKAHEAEELRQHLEELKALREAEQNRVAKLMSDLENWHIAERIREFVKAAKNTSISAASLGDMEVGSESWCAWALTEADRHDPLRKSQSPSGN